MFTLKVALVSIRRDAHCTTSRCVWNTAILYVLPVYCYLLWSGEGEGAIGCHTDYKRTPVVAAYITLYPPVWSQEILCHHGPVLDQPALVLSSSISVCCWQSLWGLQHLLMPWNGPYNATMHYMHCIACNWNSFITFYPFDDHALWRSWLVTRVTGCQ